MRVIFPNSACGMSFHLSRVSRLSLWVVQGVPYGSTQDSADNSPLIVSAAQVASSDIDYCTADNHFKQINTSLEAHTLPQGPVLLGKGG